MGRFDSVGAGASRGIRNVLEIKELKDQKDEEERKEEEERQKRLKEKVDAAREKAEAGVKQFADFGVQAAEKNAKPEELEQFRKGALASAVTYGTLLDQMKKEVLRHVDPSDSNAVRRGNLCIRMLDAQRMECDKTEEMLDFLFTPFP